MVTVASSRTEQGWHTYQPSPINGHHMPWLRTEDQGAVRWLTLDRPETKNAVPAGGWAGLERAFVDFERSSQRVLVLIGAGGNFCSGADLSFGSGVGVGGVVDRQAMMKQVGSAALTLFRLTKPTIAAVDGVAVGGGMNLALGCDVVLATTRSRFSQIFVRRGLTPDVGGSWLLPRMVGLQRAKELALSGRIVEADEALRIGLCLELVDPEHLEERASELAERFLSGAPIAQMFAKQALGHAWDVSYPEALGWEGQSQSICLGSEDVIEGVSAFLEKRPPDFKGR